MKVAFEINTLFYFHITEQELLTGCSPQQSILYLFAICLATLLISFRSIHVQYNLSNLHLRVKTEKTIQNIKDLLSTVLSGVHTHAQAVRTEAKGLIK